MVSMMFLLTQPELNRLGHIVNNVSNYCFYNNPQGFQQDIINTVFERANLTEALHHDYVEVFCPPVGDHWLSRVHVNDLPWIDECLAEAVSIIRNIILSEGLFHEVLMDEYVKVSLLVVREYSAFRYIQVEDMYDDSWLL